ncbi:(2Fe-2S)-binding protein [Haladaptatus halobius]|uniref:(2Fe-2S)-binding protein n=1 Tax=Haladaptatus halobius TaxID=2884875 RepID=UPI001D09C4CB|nr:(2Fe-2S)-binding protein [Haladaptatus halobius]
MCARVGNSKKRIDVVVNGENEKLEFDEGESLMAALRRAGYYSVKNGCSEGVCGACNVLYGENQIVRSCLVPAERYEGEELTTAEGLVSEDGELHPLQEEFLNYGAAQCGFCIPGMILSGVQLLEKNDDPTESEIRSALKGNICRCTGYIQQFEAIQAAADQMRSEGETEARSD